MTVPLFWTKDFADFAKCILSDISISNDRSFLLSYSVISDKLKIPGRLTFGGFFPVDGKPTTALEFNSVFKKFQSQTSVTSDWEWKLPPSYFYPEIFQSQYEVMNDTILTEINDMNQHVVVADWNFGCLSKGNKKKFRQAIEANLIFQRASLADISKCYEILLNNRSSLGVKVSMSEDEIYASLSKFPDHYKMFFAKVHENIVAMCLTVDIAPTVRYVLYWADNLDFRNISPVVFLFERLMARCIHEGIEILDLGISSVNGEVNEGLLAFKHNLGALVSQKKTIILRN